MLEALSYHYNNYITIHTYKRKVLQGYRVAKLQAKYSDWVCPLKLMVKHLIF